MYEDSPDELDPRRVPADDVGRRRVWASRRSGLPKRSCELRPTTCARICARTTRRTRVVVAAAGNVEHDRFVELVCEEFAEFAGQRCCAHPDRAAPRTPARHVRQKESEQAYVVVGTRGRRRARRAAIRALAAGHGARRRHVEPSLPRDSREARPGLQRLFVSSRVSRRRAIRRLRRHVAGQRRNRASI